MHCPNCLSSLSLRKQLVQRRKAHFTLNVSHKHKKMKLITTLLLICFLYSCKKDKKSESKIEEKVEINDIEKIQITKKDTMQTPELGKSKIDLPNFVDSSKFPDSLELKKLKFNGDFNGDGKLDFASVVRNKNDKQIGVLIMHNSNDLDNIVLGAGKEINGSTNLKWIEVFEKIPKGKIVAPTIVDQKTGDIIGPDASQNFKLIGDGIYMTVEESHGGGIIFWDGNKYRWYHVE